MRRDERGTALVEFVWLAILMLIPLVYVVLAVFETQRTSYAASAAARSAGRAFVTAPDERSARGPRRRSRPDGVPGPGADRCAPPPRGRLPAESPTTA